MTRYLSLIALALLLAGALATPGLTQDKVEDWSVWMGGHYTSFSDNPNKVGEYNLGLEEFQPEFRINYLAIGQDNLVRFDGHYYDKYNLYGRVTSKVGDRFGLTAQYRSLVHQENQDLLTNLEAREWLGTNFGGKILTHDVQDPEADYNTHRQEFLSRINVLLAEKHNVRLEAAHRLIREKGSEQGLSNSHCFSCHVVSETVAVENLTNSFEAKLQADLNKKLNIGYEFGYRHFNSQSPDATAVYDIAKHPVNGGSGAEFSSRQVFDDTSLVYGALPTTEKVNNKVRVKADLGDNAKLATSVGYNYTKNKNTNLKSDAWYGAAQLAMLLSPRTRLLLKARGLRQQTDDPFIDVPTYRDGRPGPQTDFDYTRYSSLDRTDGSGSAELIHRLNRQVTLSGLLGYQRVDRYDYPVVDDGVASKTLTAQAKLRYRQGMKTSGWFKYRFEKTSDPFINGKGLFEARGREALAKIIPDASSVPFVFYYEREALRYQEITTAPTDHHEFELNANFKPNPTTGLNVGAKLVLEKNSDLDSLDVKSTYFRPNVGLNLTPNSQLTLSAGYTMNYGKSQGPIAVALFDG